MRSLQAASVSHGRVASPLGDAPEVAGRRPSWKQGTSEFCPNDTRGAPAPAMTASPAVTAPQNTDSSYMDKPALRRRIRCARQALSHDYRLDAMRAIARHASRLLKRGKRVGAYLAAGSELDLEILMSVALWRGAEVYLPQIRGAAAGCGSAAWARRTAGICIRATGSPNTTARRCAPNGWTCCSCRCWPSTTRATVWGRAAVLRYHAGFSSARAPVWQTLAGGRGLRLPTRRARAARALGHPARLSIDRIRLAPAAFEPRMPLAIVFLAVLPVLALLGRLEWVAVWLYLALSLLCFALYWRDKRAAQRGGRTPEARLLWLGLVRLARRRSRADCSVTRPSSSRSACCSGAARPRTWPCWAAGCICERCEQARHQRQSWRPP